MFFIVSACLPTALWIIILMHSLRGKFSSSLPTRRSSTPQPNQQRFFPFSNKKLRVSGCQQALAIKRFKSNAQIARRNYEYIPNLKRLRLQNDKVAIVKTTRNQYNVFLRRTQDGIRSSHEGIRSSVNCINGVKHATHNDKDAALFCNSKLAGVSKVSAHRSSLIFASRYDRAEMATSYSGTVPLVVAGESKCLSPSRGGSRGRSYHEQVMF